MGEILVKEKDVVVPGDVLAQGMEYLPSFGTYRDKDDIVASRLGIIGIDGKVIKVIPLTGKYIPKRNDVIICRVEDVSYSGWRVSTNSAYAAMLSCKDAISEFIAKGADLTQFFDIGDYLVGKIINVTSQKLVDLMAKGPGLRKLRGGRIFEVNTHKVPRIIGKQGSMVSMIKQVTECKIIVGQNGLVWIDGEPKNEIIAISAIKKIEAESHISGLTERIKDFLEKETGKKIDFEALQNQNQESHSQESEFHPQETEFHPREMEQ